MKILITGVAGFIGSNLAHTLITLGHQVTGIDNFEYGRKSNIAHLLSHQQFNLIEANLCNESILDNIRADVLVHLASQKIPRYTNAFRTLDENNTMLKIIVKKCIADKIKLVFASTSDVYGKNNAIPFHEDCDFVIGPTTIKRWSYAVSKIYSEQYLIACSQEFGMEYTIMRFFGSYGPNQNTTWWGGPQSVFIQNILENKPLELHGDGLQTRTFTYVEDTVDGICKCIFHPESKNEIFNIASEPEEEVSIKGLAESIWHLMKGSEHAPEIKWIPYAAFGNYEDVRRRVPSIEKIKSKLGFAPSVSLTAGLKKTIEWQVNWNKTLAG